MAKFRGAILACEICGSLFKVPPVRANTARFCSLKCASVHRGKQRELPRVAITCAACGVVFFERQCHASRRKYCSYDCRNGHHEYLTKKSIASSGPSNGMWGGGITNHSEGYVYEWFPAHHFSSNGYVFQHRLVAEKALKENAPDSPLLVTIDGTLYLSPDYVVHHKNLDRKDNDPLNLQILTNAEHMKLHNALRRKGKEK